MNDDRVLAHDITAILEAVAPTQPPSHVLESVIDQASRRRKTPRWLALIKEPPMRTNSRVVAGAPTVRVAAVLAATFLLAVALAAAGAAGQRLLAADATIVVDQSGAGDYTTISEAVAAASDGDEVVVMPGTYVESVDVESDIVLRGDGDRAAVIIQIPDDGPTIEWPGFDLSYGIHLSDSDAEVQGITIRTPDLSTSGIVVRGGSPTITDMVVDATESPYSSARGFVYAGGGSTPTIIDNTTDAFTWIAEGADATISGLRKLREDADEVGVRVDGEGTHAIVTDNDLAMAVIHNGATGTIADNTFLNGPTSMPGAGCVIMIESAGAGVTVSGNTISGNSQGICEEDTPAAEIVANRIEGASVTAIQIQRADARIADNDIVDGGIGIVLRDGGTVLEGNRIEGNKVGLAVLTPDTATSLAGNTICGNETNLRVNDGASMPETSGNEICTDGA